MRLTIVTECANWYVRDDGLVQIKNKRGKTVILNKVFSEVWIHIGYEITKEELNSELTKVNIDEDIVEQCLNDLVTMKLVNIYNKEDSFDMLFN